LGRGSIYYPLGILVIIGLPVVVYVVKRRFFATEADKESEEHLAEEIEQRGMQRGWGPGRKTKRKRQD
jgi:hypothetical protein